MISWIFMLQMVKYIYHKTSCMYYYWKMFCHLKQSPMLKVLFFGKCYYFDLTILNDWFASFVYGRNKSGTKPARSFERKNIYGDSNLSLSGELAIIICLPSFNIYFAASQAWTLLLFYPELSAI